MFIYLGANLYKYGKCGWGKESYEIKMSECMDHDAGEAFGYLTNIAENTCNAGLAAALVGAAWDLVVVWGGSGGWAALEFLRVFFLGDELETLAGKIEAVLSVAVAIFICIICFLGDIPDDPSDAVAATFKTISFLCHSFVLTAFSGYLYEIVAGAFQCNILPPLNSLFSCTTTIDDYSLHNTLSDDQCGDQDEGVFVREQALDSGEPPAPAKIGVLWIFFTTHFWMYILVSYDSSWADKDKKNQNMVNLQLYLKILSNFADVNYGIVIVHFTAHICRHGWQGMAMALSSFAPINAREAIFDAEKIGDPDDSTPKDTSAPGDESSAGDVELATSPGTIEAEAMAELKAEGALGEAPTTSLDTKEGV